VIISIDFALPSSVVAIRGLAFTGRSLKSIRIPSSVRRIDGSAFRDVMAEAFSIDEANPYFRRDQNCLIERSRNTLVHCFSNQPKCVVPSTVEIIGVSVFGRNPVGFSLCQIEFADTSRLMRVEKRAFVRAKLMSLTLPQNVEFVDGRAFNECRLQSLKIAEGNRHFEMRGCFLVGVPDQRLIRYFGLDADIIIPNDILILGKYCLSGFFDLTSLSFADQSKLREIEHCALFDTEVPSLEIPASVKRIDGSAFGGRTTRMLRVAEGNLHFLIEGDFLLDWECRELVRYFGGSSVVCIQNEIEVFGPGCFHDHPHVVCCDFCAGSRLRSVKAGAFWKCPIGDIDLPRSVCAVERKAFPSTCHISIANLSPAKQRLFSEWQCKRRSEASAVLDLHEADMLSSS
jgi:hypothetical protein